MTQGMSSKDIISLKQKIEQVEHVESVVWYDTILKWGYGILQLSFQTVSFCTPPYFY